MTIILLTYVNRSGSSYLANLLSASDSVCVCPEGERLVSLFLESPGKTFRFDNHWKAKLSQILKLDRKLRTWGLGDDIYQALEGVSKNIDAFMAFLRCYQDKQKPDATSILFKAERLVDLFCDIEKSKIADIEVKYLSLVRDPRAVYASQKRTLIPGINRKMSKNPVFTAIFWNHFFRANIKNLELIEIHQILYRDLVANMDETISGLSGYLDLDLKGISPGGGDLLDRLPNGHRPIHQHITESPDSRKINQWREELSQEEIRLIEHKCRKHLIEGEFEIKVQNRAQLVETCKVIYFTLLYRIGHFMHRFRFHLKRTFG